MDLNSTIHIIIDTREQTPWGFGDWVESSRGTLAQGDYALKEDCIIVPKKETMECNYSIERKSLNDFIGTIASGWERFKKELTRMENRGFPSRIIIIESDFQDCCFWVEEETGDIKKPKHDHFKVTPQFVVRRVCELMYSGVCVMFAGNSGYAAALCYKILRNRKNFLIGIKGGL